MSVYKLHLKLCFTTVLMLTYFLLAFSFLLPVESLKVAIIGAGASGLTSLKYCLEERFSIDIFEQTGNIGGVWKFSNYTGDVDENDLPVYSVMYKDLITNLPKELMQLSDFPYPDMPKSYLPFQRVAQYFNDYANYFNLLPHVQFYKQVKKIDALRDTEWKLTIQNAKTKFIEVKEYDAVIICNGHYIKEVIPKIPGMELFKGKQMHSRKYRSTDSFENKRILVVGAGPSGADIASKLSIVAKKVILSYKPPILWKVSGDVTLKPVVKNISEETVTFIDNSQENVDVIMYCTGYSQDLSFLTESCDIKEEDSWIKYLYKHIINIKRPTMAIIGVPKQYCPIPVNELQVKFFIASLKKSFTLPSKNDMMKDVMDRVEYIKAKGWPERHMHKIAYHQDQYCDDIAKLANITSLDPVIQKVYAHLWNPVNRDNKHIYYKILDNESFIVNYS